ncbi:MAG: hypothetical protein DMG41_35800 [Acidobacteria bacterium]|nr:MAG: hypothetical protein AUH13_28415 [Acidobacteria bacterium 13_2_20CM_58_27]PYT75355.1 MAG: hypothetical protein DMG42_08905 [Acidobacteriota bacterium]PYT81076.1 MAG: hypothetical protein DMG41_35800 [Acidobacteriota bacterium]
MLIAQRPLKIKQALEVLCQGRFPASLIYAMDMRWICDICAASPSSAVPSTFDNQQEGLTADELA